MEAIGTNPLVASMACAPYGQSRFQLARGRLPPRTPTACSAGTVQPAPLKLTGPPKEWDWRAATRDDTLRLTRLHCPSLLPLAECGALTVVPRSALYVERRTDGYVEPERIWLVGTSHVREVITAAKPGCVVVELCRSRAGLLWDKDCTAEQSTQDDRSASSNMFNLSGESFASAASRTLRLGRGRSALALRLALASVSERALGTVGNDMGVELVLGDRPIEITLQRCWQALTLIEKLRLLKALISGIGEPRPRLREELLNLAEQFPSLMSPLIHERDTYLAWSLKRSKAVNGVADVVGVVGAGHLRGIAYALLHDHGSLKFKDLVGSHSARKQPVLVSLARSAAVEGAIGFAGWWLYQMLTSSS
eukprot:jgi/Chlat1/3515/Chrsp23S08823